VDNSITDTSVAILEASRRILNTWCDETYVLAIVKNF